MEIRAANDHDTSEIVDVLRQSLGESLVPKSVEYWRWKHVDNPFGRSPVVVAMEGGAIVGVRAFMCWRWRAKGSILNAVRAVDTATLPTYQGKGIFSKLTLAMLDQCVRQNTDFVFNTPNPKSGAGYLKMGWEQAGRLPLHVHVRSPFSIMATFAGVRAPDPAEPASPDFDAIENLEELLRESAPSSISTLASKAYLKWRYCDVPVARYGIGISGSTNKATALVIYRLKQAKFGTEFRVTDVYCRPDAMDTARELVLEKARQHRAVLVTLSGLYPARLLPRLLTLTSVAKGPQVMVRSVASDVGVLKAFADWAPSLGDLELF